MHNKLPKHPEYGRTYVVTQQKWEKLPQEIKNKYHGETLKCKDGVIRMFLSKRPPIDV
jgi:hypothetical protein